MAIAAADPAPAAVLLKSVLLSLSLSALVAAPVDARPSSSSLTSSYIVQVDPAA